jgi:hypothetical protein
MVEIIKQHDNFIQKSVEKLNALKEIVQSYRQTTNEDRINISISDIDRCAEYANYYLNDSSLYNPDVFRFDSTLINLVDSIRDNDYGLNLSQIQQEQKVLICNEIIEIVDKLIIVNQKMKLI